MPRPKIKFHAFKSISNRLWLSCVKESTFPAKILAQTYVQAIQTQCVWVYSGLEKGLYTSLQHTLQLFFLFWKHLNLILCWSLLHNGGGSRLRRGKRINVEREKGRRKMRNRRALPFCLASVCLRKQPPLSICRRTLFIQTQ